MTSNKDSLITREVSKNSEESVYCRIRKPSAASRIWRWSEAPYCPSYFILLTKFVVHSLIQLQRLFLLFWRTQVQLKWRSTTVMLLTLNGLFSDTGHFEYFNQIHLILRKKLNNTSYRSKSLFRLLNVTFITLNHLNYRFMRYYVLLSSTIKIIKRAKMLIYETLNDRH